MMTNMKSLLELYDGILLDAFGVLVTMRETLPYAKELIQTLTEREDKDFLIVTNNASATTDRIAESFKRKGLEIPEEKILSSGSLIPVWIRDNFGNNPNILYMGGKKAESLLGPAPGKKTKLEELPEKIEEKFDLLVLCSQEDENYKLNIEKLMSYLIWAQEAGCFPRLVLPNPDLIFQKGRGQYGIVSGMIARIMEEALKLRFHEMPKPFVLLGKPSPIIFERAKVLMPGRKLVMIGDQIETDVKGANGAGIPSALMLGGVVSENNFEEMEEKSRPQYVLKSLKL